ncbi:MAG: hypothetical protein JW925_07285 [Syntrophaceae bacterium]|nr:hypothetical protein [Syntrophaceae bacterium]
MDELSHPNKSGWGTIPHSGGYNTPQLAAELATGLSLGFIPVIEVYDLGINSPPVAIKSIVFIIRKCYNLKKKIAWE